MMEIKPYPPMTDENYKKMCEGWARVIRMQESATWIWPVLNAPYRRILQFLADRQLQKELFPDDWGKRMFAFVNLEQHEQLQPEELNRIIIEAMGVEIKPHELQEYIRGVVDKKEQKITLFVTGLDASIRKNNYDILMNISAIARIGWEINVLAFLETDIADPTYYSVYEKTSLDQQVFIQPLYSNEDVDLFINYLCHNWGSSVSSDMRAWIHDNCGGHYYLVKEVVRQVSSEKNISVQNVANCGFLQDKARAIVENMSEEQIEILQLITQGVPIDKKNHDYEFLLQQGWIRENGTQTLLTVPLISPHVIARMNSMKGKYFGSLVSKGFTQTEADVFQLLFDSIDSVVSREDIGHAVWGEGFLEKYSDWAIDQTIYRIRKKLKAIHAEYKIIAKKGRGFILLNK
jgi:hypothetical protein